MDVWHSDDDGFYDVQQLDKLGGNAGRGRFIANEEGKFWFWTIKPTFYPCQPMVLWGRCCMLRAAIPGVRRICIT